MTDYQLDDGAYEDTEIDRARRARHEPPPWRDDYTPEDFDTEDPEAARAARLAKVN